MMTLKRTRGRSWTQMGKSSMPALPRHSRAHMFSQFLRVMLVTWTLLGLSASSQVMFSLTGVLSKATCSSIHSRNALLLSTMDKNLGSELSQPAMFLSSYEASAALVQALEEEAELLYLEGGEEVGQVGHIQPGVREAPGGSPHQSRTHLSCRSESSNISL